MRRRKIEREGYRLDTLGRSSELKYIYGACDSDLPQELHSPATAPPPFLLPPKLHFHPSQAPSSTTAISCTAVQISRGSQIYRAAFGQSFSSFDLHFKRNSTPEWRRVNLSSCQYMKNLPSKLKTLKTKNKTSIFSIVWNTSTLIYSLCICCKKENFK